MFLGNKFVLERYRKHHATVLKYLQVTMFHCAGIKVSTMYCLVSKSGLFSGKRGLDSCLKILRRGLMSNEFATRCSRLVKNVINTEDHPQISTSRLTLLDDYQIVFLINERNTFSHKNIKHVLIRDNLKLHYKDP
jgi:hypothetical protein